MTTAIDFTNLRFFISQVILVPSNSAAAKASFDLYKAYQMAVHHDPATKLKPESFERFLCTSPLQVIIVLIHPRSHPALPGATGAVVDEGVQEQARPK